MSYPGPKAVDSPTYFPGACVTGHSAVDLVDFGFELPPLAEGGRFYLWEQHVKDAARSIGMVGAEEIGRSNELRAELAAAQARVTALEEELLAVRRSVALTLQQGVVVDKRTGAIRARPLPGRKVVL